MKCPVFCEVTVGGAYNFWVVAWRAVVEFHSFWLFCGVVRCVLISETRLDPTGFRTWLVLIKKLVVATWCALVVIVRDMWWCLQGFVASKDEGLVFASNGECWSLLQVVNWRRSSIELVELEVLRRFKW